MIDPISFVSVHSELVFFPSRSGTKIVAYIDQAIVRDGREERFIVMSPKYGETKKNNLQLAYFLAANGFTVLRFDFTCHFGESDGDMLDFTLPAAVEDTLAAIDYLEKHRGASTVSLLASSLSALTAFRAVERDDRIDHLVTMVGVVDLTYTLVKVYQDDLIGGFINGKRYGVLDILGHEVNMDRFFEATITANMHTLESTQAAMRGARCPVSFFPADNDAWVRIEDIEAVAACAARGKVYPIEGAMHEVRENQDAAEKTMRLLVSICREHSFKEEFSPTQAFIPDKKVVFAQNKIERERLRRARPIKEQEDAFWGKYLEKYRVMEKMDDYQNYLDLVGELLGRFGDGEVVLDAGCGNGLFGVWVVRELLQRQTKKFQVPPLYFGMDLTDSGLSDATGKHSTTKMALANRNTTGMVGSVQLMYSRVDLDLFGANEVLPEDIISIADNSFDKITCSLLLSYLKSPARLLQQLHRVLRPGGRIVISSMKPFCDLSSIYRDFVEQKAATSDIESARELLRAAGAIKVKQEQGYYAFFSSEELSELLVGAGFQTPQCYISLGNQACVAVATK
jgi:SAM-dependent methyltransferase/alpha-beta hydrolase superfamily lysophospholipase